MKTIEHRIVDLIAERLRQHLVSGVMVLVDSESETPSYDAGNISASGTYSGSYPRSFELSFDAPGKVDILETTLFAELGNDQPAPVDVQIDVEIGVAFAIPGTGVSITMADAVAIGTKYLIRMGLAYASIPEICLHPVNFYDVQAPGISIFYSGDSSVNQTVERTRSTLELNIVLGVSPEMFSNGDHLEILGDIRDCLNRDPHLWDGSTCLSDDVSFTGSNYFDQTDRGNSYFVVTAQIVYQSKTKNARIK